MKRCDGKAFHWVLAAAVAAALASCGRDPGAVQPVPETAAAGPAPECTTDTLVVDGLTATARNCRQSTGHWRVQVDAVLPGLALWRDDERVATVLHVFRKSPDDAVAAILPALRAGGYVPADAECTFQAVAMRPAPRTVQYLQLKPAGATLRAFEAAPADQVPDPPCGAYGWSTHGVRYFISDLAQPDRVLYVDEGQDGTFLDAASLRWQAASPAP